DIHDSSITANAPNTPPAPNVDATPPAANVTLPATVNAPPPATVTVTIPITTIQGGITTANINNIQNLPSIGSVIQNRENGVVIAVNQQLDLNISNLNTQATSNALAHLVSFQSSLIH